MTHRRPIARRVLGAAVAAAITVVVAEIPLLARVDEPSDEAACDELGALARGAAGATNPAGRYTRLPRLPPRAVRAVVAALGRARTHSTPHSNFTTRRISPARIVSRAFSHLSLISSSSLA